MKVSNSFRLKMLNILIIKINQKAPYVLSVGGTFSTNQWQLPEINCVLPFAQTQVLLYETLHIWQHTQQLFS
jgi:hypothetical protein